jgi:hypothetical protein
MKNQIADDYEGEAGGCHGAGDPKPWRIDGAGY